MTNENELAAVLKRVDKQLEPLEEKLIKNYNEARFDYPFNLKGILYFICGSLSLPFFIYLSIGWLFESMIRGDVWLFHTIFFMNNKFGEPNIGVLFIIPITSAIAIAYMYFIGAYPTRYFLLHTDYFFRILNRKIDLKYHYTPSSFVNVVLWVYIVISGFFSMAVLFAAFDSTMVYGIIFSLYVFICPFVAWFLKRAGLKWLWLVLLPSILIVFIECSANYIKHKKIDEMSFLIDFNTALWNIISAF